MAFEFSLIERYFKQLGPSGRVDLGVGDDCSLLHLKPSLQLAQSIDTLVCGVHFPENIDPYLLGWRALATAASDLAAMGANAHSFSMALTLPKAELDWLSRFAKGLSDLAKRIDISLIGGDTTRGPLPIISIQVQGTLPKSKAMRRDQAQLGDLIVVSGSIGDAGVGLNLFEKNNQHESLSSQEVDFLLSSYLKPFPKISLGLALREVGCLCAIDVSDGLFADLSHVLKASGVGACIDLQAIPRSKEAIKFGQTLEQAICAGDDYQLCFCISKKNWLKLNQTKLELPLSVVGQITSKPSFTDTFGNSLGQLCKGYQHF